MIHSLIMLAFFAAGVAGAHWRVLPGAPVHPGLTLWALLPLVLLVGVTAGSDAASFRALRKEGPQIALVPLAVVVGTLAGALAVSWLLHLRVSHALAVGAGMGYYSLSSVIILPIAGADLSVTALLSNMSRELLTLLLTPLLVRVAGRLAPVAAGGATAMDTTLPVISRFSGGEFTFIAVVSGMALTLAVPLLVPAMLAIGAAWGF